MINSGVGEAWNMNIMFAQPVGPFAMNQFLFWCTETREAAIVDSGAHNHTIPCRHSTFAGAADPEPFIEFAKARQLTIKYLLQVCGCTARTRK